VVTKKLFVEIIDKCCEHVCRGKWDHIKNTHEFNGATRVPISGSWHTALIMASSKIKVPVATIVSVNLGHCLQFSCPRCRSYGLQRSPDGRGFICRDCRATASKGKPNFFLRLEFEVEDNFLRAVASDACVERLFGCTAEQWPSLTAHNAGTLIRSLEQQICGCVCSPEIELPGPRRRQRGAHPKVIEFNPRPPSFKFSKLLVQLQQNVNKDETAQNELASSHES